MKVKNNVKERNFRSFFVPPSLYAQLLPYALFVGYKKDIREEIFFMAVKSEPVKAAVKVRYDDGQGNFSALTFNGFAVELDETLMYEGIDKMMKLTELADKVFQYQRITTDILREA